MSFSRQKPAGWVTNDPITPTQINGIDANLANAFDKVGGETITGSATFEGPVLMGQSSSNGGSVQWRIATLGDADATIDCDVDEYIFTAAPTVARVFTLRSTTVPRPLPGTKIHVACPVAGGTDMAQFKREDATEIARIVVPCEGSVTFVWDGTYWQVSAIGGTGEYV